MNASQQIDSIIKTYGGWKGQMLADIRAVVINADSKIVEEIKWKMATRPEGLPVWSGNGIVCFAETWKDNIKLLFPKGAKLTDHKKLFNARLQSKTTRAIEFKEGDDIDATGLRELILEALELD